MQPGPSAIPLERAAALAAYGILDTPREARFDSISRNLADQAKVPIAYIAFIDQQRLWFKSSVGVPFLEIPTETSITATLLNEGKTESVVTNIDQLDKFKPGSIAADRQGTRSLVMKAIVTPEGVVIGAVCIMDTVPREFGENELALVTAATNAVVELLEIRRVVEKNANAAEDEHAANLGFANHYEENIQDVVRTFMQEALENFDWWAAQAWWYREDGLYPGYWQTAPHTPLGLRPISQTRYGSVEVVKIRKAYLEPTVVPVTELTWMSNQDRLNLLGARYAVVMDIFGAAEPALRMVFIIPSPRFFDESTKKFFALSTALLPKVITRERVRSELQYRSAHDALTGLLNRRGLNHLIEESANETTSNRVVMFLDLNNFKTINDKYGHAIGDELLIHVANQLVGNTRPTDTVARIGGDEFVVVTSDTDLETATEVLADRVYQALATPFTLSNGVSWTSAASVGVASWQSGTPFERALEKADNMMYNAKKATSGVEIEDRNSRTNGANNEGLGNVIKFMKIAEDEKAAPWAYLLTIESQVKNPDVDTLVNDIGDAYKKSGIQSDHFVLWLPKALWFDEDAVVALVEKLQYPLGQAELSVILNGNGASADAKTIAINLRLNKLARTVLSGFGSGNKEFELLQSIQPVALAIDPDLAKKAAMSAEYEMSVKAVTAICDALGIKAITPFGCTPEVMDKLSEMGCKLRVIA